MAPGGDGAPLLIFPPLEASMLGLLRMPEWKSAPPKMSMLPPRDLLLLVSPPPPLNRSMDLRPPNEALPAVTCERLPVTEEPPDSILLRERECENGGGAMEPLLTGESGTAALMATGSVEEKGVTGEKTGAEIFALPASGFVEDSRREVRPTLSDTMATSGL